MIGDIHFLSEAEIRKLLESYELTKTDDTVMILESTAKGIADYQNKESV